MLAQWDPSSNQLALSNGLLVGNLRTPGDFDVDFEHVEEVSLAGWRSIILAASDDRDFTVAVSQQDKFVLIRALADGLMEIAIDGKGPEWERDFVQQLMGTICEANGGHLTTVTYEEGYWMLYISCAADRRTTADLFATQDAFEQIFGLPERSRLTQPLGVDATYQILMRGVPGALIGFVESDWLEVKSRGYDLDSFAGQVELAQDVSRFANGDESALLVLGLRTERQDGTDRIVKVALLDLPANASARYREVIERRVYPAIEGLSIDLVRIGERGVLVIRVPKQSETVKPFLAHGAVVDGKNEGSFISIVRRRGEGSIPTTPAEIHALLSAGRAALRQQFNGGPAR